MFNFIPVEYVDNWYTTFVFKNIWWFNWMSDQRISESSNQTMQKLDGTILSKASVDKKHTTKDKTWPSRSSSAYLSSHICLDVLMGWRHILPRPNSILNLAIFELSNDGQSLWEFVVQKVGLLVKIMA